MAEQERKTKAERRAEARAERRRKEEEAARQRRKDAIRNGVIAAAVIAVIALIAIPAISNLTSGEEPADTTISQEDAVEAFRSAGCEIVVEDQPLEDRTHHQAAEAPPADVLYGASSVRPNHSGPHFTQWSDPVGGVPSSPLDERALTHNLEHGSVVVWFDADQVDDATVDDIEAWMQDRKDLGFSSGRNGGSIFVSPYEGFTDDRPIAIRAWGYAVNCDEWSQVVADSTLIDKWGSRGLAPERSLSPYPAGTLGYAEDSDGTEAPTDDATDGPTDGATDDPTDQG